MTGHRTLSVEVDDILIEDGGVAPPSVGAVMTLPLRFIEAAEPREEQITIHALLDADRGAPVWQYTGEASPRRWQWSGLLRGDGWTAAWSGYRPIVGQVQLAGRFFSVLDGSLGGYARGRVTRVQIVSERTRRVGGTDGGWEHKPGHRRLRDVDAAPRFFDRPWFHDLPDPGLPLESGQAVLLPARGNMPDEYDDDVGVLVELDLDDVPALPARPRLAPASVSAAGGLLWVTDTELPLVMSVDRDRAVREYVLPAPIGVSQRPWATPTGCWVTGPAGVFRLDPGVSPRRVDERAVTVAAVAGESLLSCGPERRWQLHAPGREPIDVAAPEGIVIAAVADDDTFVVLLREGHYSTAKSQLVRVRPTGALTVGPPLPPAIFEAWPYLAGPPLRVISGSSVYVVGSDLTLVPEGELPSRFLAAGQEGELVWITGHPPDGTGRSRWWPLAGPTTYGTSSRQFWLMTLLDPHTLEPVRSCPIFGTRPSVARDEDGTIWLVADGLRSVSDTTMQWPTELDVAGLLDVTMNR